jgi:CheY-like chemotaxis protein
MSLNTRLRVLYVDDSADCRAMVSTLLECSQVETRSAENARQALGAIQSERFDLYLLEAWLPELDGFELCRQIREDDAHTPIVFFSGACYEADTKRGIKAGANAYVRKPDIEALLASVTKYMPHQQLSPSSR